VLRDGQLVRTGPAAAETEDTLVAAMLGRSVGRTYPQKHPPAADAAIALSVRDLTAAGVADASLEVRAGEIVALAGLVGAGRSELARAIYGAVPATSGELRAGDAPLGGTPLGSIRAKVTMIPESRKDDGLLLTRPVRENVSLASLRSLGRLGFVRRRLEATRAKDALGRVAAAGELEATPSSLSGGNQQKLLFARALLAHPAVLIADEPTRGVDVGAKRDLYELIAGLAASGVAVLLISNEVEEVLGLAHRVLVLRGGRIVAELAGDRMTEEAILAASFGRAWTAA
jgi:simple sugar transport system ATP-binding protein/ribose transport system ATP-binding protein